MLSVFRLPKDCPLNRELLKPYQQKFDGMGDI